MLKAVLFDFDGTIVDSLHLHLQAWRKAFARCGKNLTDEEIISGAFYSTNEEMKEIFNLHNVEQLEKLYWSHMDEVFEEFKLHENIIEILNWLRDKGTRMAVVSFASSDKIKSHLKSLKIDGFFEFLLGPNDVSHPKPHPEIVEKAMKSFGVNPNETLLIGDTEMDLKTGKNAKVKTALYLPKTNLMYVDVNRLRALKADFEFENFSELPEKIKRLL